MNKRARMRLIAVTVVILVVVVGFVAISGNSTAYSKTVDEVVSDTSLVGKQVKVAGKVVEGSWDKKTDPMKFKIVAENDEAGNGPAIAVVYRGTTPGTFGDGVTAIVTGELTNSGTIESNDMITKCPSKYENAEGLRPISDLQPGYEGKAIGFVVAGSLKQVPDAGDRFLVAGTKDGAKTFGVLYDGALPSGMAEGSQVVITGTLGQDGKFTATDVALPQK